MRKNDLFFLKLQYAAHARYANEKERQAMLMRMKQARMKTLTEEKYDAAVLVSGLMLHETSQVERFEKLKRFSSVLLLKLRRKL